MSYIVHTNTDRMDLPWLIEQLQKSYWGKWLKPEQIGLAVDASLCFWIYHFEGERREPVGFARVVTDGAIFSSITDFFIVKEYRHNGLGRLLMEHMLTHPVLARTGCILNTRDAAGFYARFGFRPVTDAVLLRQPT